MSEREPGPDERRKPDESAPDDARTSIDRARRARLTKLAAALTLVVLFMVFVIRNSGRVEIDFVFFTRNARLVWIMLACGVVGGVVGFLVGRPGRGLRGDPGSGPRRPGGGKGR